MKVLNLPSPFSTFFIKHYFCKNLHAYTIKTMSKTFRSKRKASPRSTLKQPKPERQGITKEQFSMVIGFLFLIIAAIFAISFISYLFTGEADHDLVQSNFRNALELGDKKAANALGVFGAYISHWFIFKWFGVAALGWIPIIFFTAFRLITNSDIVKIDLNRLAKGTLFYVLFVSLFTGFFVFHFDINAGKICGGIGYRLNEMLDHVIGWGSILIILGILFIWMVFFHGLTNIDDYVLAEYFGQGKADKTKPEIIDHQATEQEISSIPQKPFAGGVNFEITPPKEEIKEKEITFEVETVPEILPKKDTDVPLEIEESETSFLLDEDENDSLLEEFGPYDPKLDLSGYQYPPISIMQEHRGGGSKVTAEELEANKINIVETMRNFSIGITSIKATIGPTVTLYEIVPEAGVRISKIKNLEDDIALNLAALGIRIIAPMPGKGTIGIEVPNKNREMVSMKTVLESDKFRNSNYELPIILGKTIANEIFVADLAKMPHLLMAGATGQGKSVGINVILASLLYKKHPAEVKFVMVDPKKVELSLFNKIERHFLATLPNAEDAIITDTKKVIYTLNSLCIEMDTRYDLLKDAGVRNIREYNAKFTKRKLNPEKGNRYLPYIVLVIDELADLMMTAGKEVEQPIARLAQLARAIGIHLIVATQRPSVNVITGIIKANFPARLSFKVTAKVDSRTILDTGGADQLVGNGDMLLAVGSDMVRLQCPFVDTPEIEGVCDFIGSQRGYESAYMLPEYYGDDEPDSLDFDPSDLDVKFEEAARLLVTFQQGSTSLIQRKMKLGYNRAGRIIDQLEGAGIVGPFEGSKAREVLIQDLDHLNEILENLRK